ncbi:MAG: chorismate synthase [Bacteroidales bacterium]|nr:chorismate synthase [Bacteroidales bacterium]
MKNSIGEHITFTLFGESHGDAIGGVMDGLPCGIPVDDSLIEAALAKRRPCGKGETARVESDNFEIISGLFNGYTTGEPLTIIIENSNIRSNDYEATRHLARPSHADYVSHLLHEGYEDYRGGGHFSGRLTAPIVALGAICGKMLGQKGITIATHILKCGKAEDVPFSNDAKNLEKEIEKVNTRHFPLISDCESEVENEIERVRSDSDSIGGVIQTAIANFPATVGEPWFGSMEGQLANALFSIGGIKGVEFGLGFGFSNVTGKSANDSFYNDNGEIKTITNNNGGINGGISNGMPIIFNCAVKPTPSIAAPQQTINMETGENETLVIKGRHDPAIIRRICPVVTAITSIVLCDMLKGRFSNSYFKS